MDLSRIEPVEVLMELVFDLLNTVEFNLGVRNLGVSTTRKPGSSHLTNGFRKFVLSPRFFAEFLSVVEQFESILPYRIIDPFGALKYPSCR
jgi:hypothetical protein